MGVYADILTREQGTAPERMHVVLGDGTVATVGVSSIIHYFRVAQERFLEYVGAPPAESAGAPCGHCTFCRWAPFCAAEWEATSHLSIVAGMTRGHAEALRQADVPDLPALAALGPGTRVAGIQPESSEERRVGKACVRTCGARGSPN